MGAAPKLDPYKQRFPLKGKAAYAVKRALKTGGLSRQPCEVCGSDLVVAHHPDYSKPLDVLWLCHRHHLAWHREHGQGANGGDAPIGPHIGTRETESLIIGSRYGALILLEELVSGVKARWLCKCDCGQRCIRGRSSLVNKETRSTCRRCYRRSMKAKALVRWYADQIRDGFDLYPPIWTDLDDAYLGPLSVDLTYFDEYRGLGTDIIGVGGHAGFYDERVGS